MNQYRFLMSESPILPKARENFIMLDILFLILGGGLFWLATVYVRFCEKL